MKRFLFNIFLFCILSIVTVFAVFWQADGSTDPFYLRFTSNSQSSLILGTSRAAQGILPEVLNEELNRKDFYNYSFTVGHSPYGAVYLRSIKAKLEKGKKDGIFILAVDPWSVSSRTRDPNDFKHFRENNLSLGEVSLVNYHPNFEYLLDSYSSQYLDILRRGGYDKVFLHKDGWLEVTVGMDSIELADRIENKVKVYREENLPKYHFSNYRLEYLAKTISYLKSYGEVYLVRLPINSKIFEIENKLVFDFDDKIENLGRKYSVPYFNLTNRNSDFQYTDGNHLYKESGRKVSRLLSQMIIENKNRE